MVCGLLFVIFCFYGLMVSHQFLVLSYGEQLIIIMLVFDMEVIRIDFEIKIKAE